MKVLTVSDNVLPQLEDARNLRERYGDVDGVVSCGDMPAPYLDFIVSVLNMPLLYVRGNHDLDYSSERPGGDNLHQRVIYYKGLSFAGLEGSPRYNRDPVQYSEYQMWLMVLGMVPGLWLRRLRYGYGVDVLVTHAPPRDIHDLPDKPHRGFRSLRFLLRVCRPRYMLHGHVDTWDRRKPTETEFAGTKIINVNPSKLLVLEKANTHGS